MIGGELARSRMEKGICGVRTPSRIRPPSLMNPRPRSVCPHRRTQQLYITNPRTITPSPINDIPLKSRRINPLPMPTSNISSLSSSASLGLSQAQDSPHTQPTSHSTVTSLHHEPLHPHPHPNHHHQHPPHVHSGHSYLISIAEHVRRALRLGRVMRWSRCRRRWGTCE